MINGSSPILGTPPCASARGWLPDVLSGNRVWKEPLLAEDLAMLFDAFEADLETELVPPG